ncbi:hypothetical protein EVAR_75253_1 [Eumeta japonica]|uniref:Uncharacterized protein n=1 Tax=Eumeta variegata TaxID=151549 RepID=A0A4C1V934_EUMVA|nr:hypothetical protein EVAR_75253_1 [Eumeta japonica]
MGSENPEKTQKLRKPKTDLQSLPTSTQERHTKLVRLKYLQYIHKVDNEHVYMKTRISSASYRLEVAIIGREYLKYRLKLKHYHRRRRSPGVRAPRAGGRWESDSPL